MVSREYITTQGDTWDSIAFKLWQNESLSGLLISANPDQRDVLIFEAGVTLTVPEAPALTTTKGLPPWMK